MHGSLFRSGTPKSLMRHGNRDTSERDDDSMEETNVDIRKEYVPTNLSSRFKSSIQNEPESNLLSAFADLISPSNIVYVNGNPYIKIQSIGKGNCSEIFKVMDSEGSFYALKRVQVPRGETEVYELYRNEIRLLTRLADDDLIIDLYDYEIDESKRLVLLLLELGETDLATIISHQKDVKPNFLRFIWQEMLRAVESIHREGIIHGDLRPSNFLFVKGTLKLIDFGIARVISGDATSTSFGPRFIGRSYRAPEAYTSSEVKLGKAADVFSLGCILYELVYRRNPFPENTLALSPAIVAKLFPRKFKHPDFDLLVNVLKSCLDVNSKARPTIEQLLEMPYVRPSSASLENRSIPFTRNLTVLAKQIQKEFPDADFTAPAAQSVVAALSSQLVLGVQMKIEGVRCETTED